MARRLLIVLSCFFMMTSFVCLLGAVRYEHHEQRQSSSWVTKVKGFFVPEKSGNRVVMPEEQQPQEVNYFLVFLSKLLGPIYDWVVTAYMNLRDPIPTPDTIGNFADEAVESSLLLEESKFCQTDCPICYAHFEGEDIVAAFKCGHVFCVECANTALSYQPRCSVCRMAINCFSRLFWKPE